MPLLTKEASQSNWYCKTQVAFSCLKSTIEVPQMCEICSKLTTKTPGQSQLLTEMFNNFYTVFIFLLFSLKNEIPATIEEIFKRKCKNYLRKIMVVVVGPIAKLK